MISSSIKATVERIREYTSQHKILSVLIILTFVVSSFAGIIFVSFISSVKTVPEFELTEFCITNLELEHIEVNISLEFAIPSQNAFRISQISCDILDTSQADQRIIAQGESKSPIHILSNQKIISNISFEFTTSNIQELVSRFIEGENFSLTGKILFPYGFSSPFEIRSENMKIGFFPTLSLLNMHPIAPGDILEISLKSTNPHVVPFNITEARFEVLSPEYGLLGDVNFTNLIIPPRVSTLMVQFKSGETELTWLFEQVLNNGTPPLEIVNFTAVLAVETGNIEIEMKVGPQLKSTSYESGLEILGIENLDIEGSRFVFDIIIGIKGTQLWGYNITPATEEPWAISFDFAHSLSGDELQVIGNGSSNVTRYINCLESTEVPITVNIFPVAATELILIWIQQQSIEINIRNGHICLQFYEVELKISFSYTAG